MAISDLTNTTWVFKQGEFTDEISITNATYNINFICNSVNYSQIILADSYDWGTISYNTTEVYMYHYEDASQTGWYETYYRTIEITGGTDVTNANLISWLTTNATQQATSVDIKLGTNTLTGVDTISVTDATDTSIQREFKYGVTPSATVGIKVGNNTLTGVNAIIVKDTSNVDVTFGYEAPTYSITISGYNTRGYTINVYATSDSNNWFSPNEKIGTITATSGNFSYNYNVTKPYIWFYSSGWYDQWHVYTLTNATYITEDWDENDKSFLLCQITGNNAVIGIEPET